MREAEDRSSWQKRLSYVIRRLKEISPRNANDICYGSWIHERSLPTCLQHRQPQTSPMCKSSSTAGSVDQDVTEHS